MAPVLLGSEDCQSVARFLFMQRPGKMAKLFAGETLHVLRLKDSHEERRDSFLCLRSSTQELVMAQRQYSWCFFSHNTKTYTYISLAAPHSQGFSHSTSFTTLALASFSTASLTEDMFSHTHQ